MLMAEGSEHICFESLFCFNSYHDGPQRCSQWYAPFWIVDEEQIATPQIVKTLFLIPQVPVEATCLTSTFAGRLRAEGAMWAWKRISKQSIFGPSVFWRHFVPPYQATGGSRVHIPFL